MTGFLGTGATFSADFNLVAHVAMGIALLGGTLLARRKRYRAHKYCQSTVLLLNLPLIAFIMVPSFRDQVQPQLPGSLGDRFYAVATVHAVIGVIAQVLGLYILLVAGTKLLPRRLRFRRYKPWMRTELVLWWIVVLAGVGVYAVWYVAPAASSPPGAHGSSSFTVTLVNLHAFNRLGVLPYRCDFHGSSGGGLCPGFLGGAEPSDVPRPKRRPMDWAGSA